MCPKATAPPSATRTRHSPGSRSATARDAGEIVLEFVSGHLPAAARRADPAELVYLIVDDNRFARALLKNLLAALGIRNTIEAAGGRAALRMLWERHVDVVLIDCQMPPIDGIEFTLQVRRGDMAPDPEIPIIMISANTRRSLVVRAREAGVHEFLAKPVSPEALLARIRACVLEPRRFIRTETYAGPDRRWLNRGPKDGAERRRGAASYKKP